MSETLKDLKLSNDEVNRLQKAFKDPEFCKMFSEYAQEISDPVNRKRYEDEIKMAESERGMDTEFINPIPNYVLKSRNWPSLSAKGDGSSCIKQKTTLTEGQKLFINICSSEKIGKPAMGDGPGENGDGKKSGLHWSIPHSFSPPQEDLDKSHNTCIICDVVFHPESITLAASSQVLRRLLDSTAIEGVKRNFDLYLGLSKEYASTLWFENSLDSSERQLRLLRCVRTLKGVKHKGALRPTIIRRKRPDFEECQEKCQSNEKAMFEAARRGPHPKESLAALAKLKNSSKETEKDSSNSKLIHSDSKYKLPVYKIIHSTEFSIQNYRNAPDSVPQTRPDCLKIDIMLPGIGSADCIDLDITDKKLHLLSEKPVAYQLDLDLPYTVDFEKGKAKFDKQLHKLCLTIPVISLNGSEFLVNTHTSGPTTDPITACENDLIEVLPTKADAQISPTFGEKSIELKKTSRFHVSPSSSESTSETLPSSPVLEDFQSKSFKESKKKRKKCKKKSKLCLQNVSVIEDFSAELSQKSLSRVVVIREPSVTSHSVKNSNSFAITQDGIATSHTLQPEMVPISNLFVNKSFSFAPVRFRQDPSSFSVLIEIKNVMPESLRLFWSTVQHTPTVDEYANSVSPLRLLLTCSSRGSGGCTLTWGVVLHCPSEGASVGYENYSDDENKLPEELKKRSHLQNAHCDSTYLGRPNILSCDVTSRNVCITMSKPTSIDDKISASTPWWESVAIGRTMGPGLQKVPVVGLLPISLYAPKPNSMDVLSRGLFFSSFRIASQSQNHITLHSTETHLLNPPTSEDVPLRPSSMLDNCTDVGQRISNSESLPLKGILKQRSTSECSIDEFNHHFGTCGIGLDPLFSSDEFGTASSSENVRSAVSGPQESISDEKRLPSSHSQPVSSRRRLCSVNFTMKPEKVAFSQYDSVETLRTLLKNKQKNVRRSERRRRYNSYTAPSVLINELNFYDRSAEPPMNHKKKRQQLRKEKFMPKINEKNIPAKNEHDSKSEVSALISENRSEVVDCSSSKLTNSLNPDEVENSSGACGENAEKSLCTNESRVHSSGDEPKTEKMFESKDKTNSVKHEIPKPHATKCPIPLNADAIFELDDDY